MGRDLNRPVFNACVLQSSGSGVYVFHCRRPYLRHVTSYHPIMRGREKPAQKAVPTWPTSMANMLAQRLSSMGTRWGLWDQAASQLTVRSALKLHRYVSHQPQRQRTSSITHRSPAGGACAVGMVLGGLAAQSEAHWSAEKCRVPSTGRLESGWAAVCAVRCSTAHTHEVVNRRGLQAERPRKELVAGGRSNAP